MKSYYHSWKYIQELLITNPSATEGFQGSFLLNWKPGMRKDFRDLRFTDKNGNPISHYLEVVSNFSSCRVWLALPANKTLLYMYYGNGQALSESDGAKVFDFWDDFNRLSSSVWTTIHAFPSIINGTLVLSDTSYNEIIQSVRAFGYNLVFEARMYHASGNRSIAGFFNTSTNVRVAWLGAVAGSNLDFGFTDNGSDETYLTDLSRGGSTYYVYGIKRLSTSAKFYVNYALRGTISTTVPTSNLPLAFYSEYNRGSLTVDWVRIRKYAATEPTITLGKRVTNQPKAYPWDNAITEISSIGMVPEVVFQYRMSLTSSIGMKKAIMFRDPNFFRTEPTGPYPEWKFKGDIRTPKSASASTVNVLIPASPGMTSDGRDLRFSTTSGRVLKYYIESLTAGVFSVWVEVPTNTSKVHYFYGNGLATSESDESIYSGPASPVTIQNIYPSTVVGKYAKWKFKGEINIASPDTQAVQLNVSIPILPGMALDGRDLRFSTTAGVSIPYYLESVSETTILCIIKVPANTRRVFFYYGNGTAVSASSPSEVFDFWDTFDSLDGLEWSTVAGSVLCTGSTLRISHPTLNSLVRSVDTYGQNTVCEVRMHHPSLNMTIAGFWADNENRAIWLGCYGEDTNDYCYTKNGTNYTVVDDTVNRYGTTYHVYGVANLSAGPKFYVDYAFRRQITTTKPTGDLPITLYSQANKGDLTVDWVRIRKYTTSSASVGRHYPQAQSVAILEETLTPEAAIIERHYPQQGSVIPYYPYISEKATVGMQASEPTYIERRELADYNIMSCDVSKSTSDTYLSSSAEFADLTVPPEQSTVKFYAHDSAGTTTLIFHGKVLTNSPALSSIGNSVSMQATDLSRNLAAQRVPWNYQIVDGSLMSWSDWIRTLLAPEKTGVYAGTILDTDAAATQFSFSPSSSRLEAIQEIANYTNSIINIKLKTRTINGFTVTRPEFYCVPPEYIDQSVNGFDLPAPLTFVAPDSSLIDNPSIASEADEKINCVIVHGVLSESGETTVAAAYSPRVYLGEEKAREKIIEDKAISEKNSTAEIEAIKWLLYFLTPRMSVTAKFVNRFDFELYQRIRFGAGFSKALQDLTSITQIPYVVCYDPRDEANSTHVIDVSGVPTPSWMRISEIKYHCEPPYYNTVEIKAITDYIYSASDPVVISPYDTYLAPGYFEPVIEDLIGTTESIVETEVKAQLQPEICTVLSIDSENVPPRWAVVQTASGKLVTVTLTG